MTCTFCAVHPCDREDNGGCTQRCVKTPALKSEMAKPRTRRLAGVRREGDFTKVKMINKFREVATKAIKALITIIDRRKSIKCCSIKLFPLKGHTDSI